ncbi:alpha/beta hydrolase [Aquimarina macrocephali]|uniref:alpha/beta hydrolase n=1 Tax=Aquimarina macrocephali TaxID=666563 RepID=UPI0004B0AA2C|nr:hypothetical protein [Aquimarina macrocephali]
MKHLIKSSLAKAIVVFAIFLFYSCSYEEDMVLENETLVENKELVFEAPLPPIISDGPYNYKAKNYSFFTQNQEEHKGKYYMPVGGFSNYPLALIMHGNGFAYNEYDILQKHLAKHGIASASIQWDSGKHDLSVNTEMTKHINWLFNQYPQLINSIALIGHSMGGGAVVRFADDLETTTGKNVKSVVSLAPALQHDMNVKHNLISTIKGLLIIYSGNDEDRYGAKSFDGREQSGFKFYDECSAEGSTFSNLFPAKDMIFFKDGRHTMYTDRAQQPLNYQYSGVNQNKVINAYILAHLKLYLQNHPEYNQFFKYQRRPSNMPQNDVSEFYQQHTDAKKSVLANFENNSSTQNYAGGDIVKSSSGIITMKVGNSWKLHSYSPHHTKAMRITWTKRNVGSSFVKFKYPSSRNLSSYSFLSIRASQIYKNIYNTTDKEQDFYIRLKDKQGIYSKKVKISDFGIIPYPIKHSGSTILPLQTPISKLTKSAMTSTLIPLSAFGNNINLSNIKEVFLVFDVPGHETGAIMIDNLEFYK